MGGSLLPPFFMPTEIFQLLSAWPDQLLHKQEFSCLNESARQLRLGNSNTSEIILLKPGLISCEGDKDIVGFLRLMSLLYSGNQIGLFINFKASPGLTIILFTPIVLAQLKLAVGDLDGFSQPGINWSEPPDSEFLLNSRVAFSSTGNLDL